jgi:uncharacterized protein (TIGR03437 family)
VLALPPSADSTASPETPALTPAPNGPYRIVENRILDRQNRGYLIRGTEVVPLDPNRTNETDSAIDFGPLSATALITIRQRLNMNAVRLPVGAKEYNAYPPYRTRVERLVRLANQFELLVILEASGVPGNTANRDLDLFWTQAAADFRDNPNVFFAPLSARHVAAIRQSGARQPLIVALPDKPSVKDRNVVYEVRPSYAGIRTEGERREHLGSAASVVPIIVNGLDPQFDRPAGECAAFPDDPAAATALVQANLKYFDAERISWILSSFTAGKLITDYRYFIGTKLDAGWTCGKPDGVPAGLGLVLLSHLWGAAPLGLFTVGESRGGLVIARGSISTAYGPILADEEMGAHGPPLPKVLGNVSIRITDSHGIARFAPLLHTGAGWAFISFVVPDECATGPAEVAVVRADGSVSKSKVLIADVAPGLFTFPPDGRSAAAAQVTQRMDGKPGKSFPSWECGQGGCRAASIPLSPGVSTSVRLLGTGFRHAGERPDVRVSVGGMPAPVLSIGRSAEPGNDQLTIQLPDALEGAGETDLYFTVNGQLSNVVRINCGSGR